MITIFTYKVDQDINSVLPRSEIDAEPLFRLIDESRATLTPWLPWVPNVMSPEDEKQALVESLQQYGKSVSLDTLIRYQGDLAGMISFNSINAANQSADLGYWLGNKFVGKGIIHHAVISMCSIGFNDYRLNKIEIIATVENQRSNQVAKEAGFHFDGHIRSVELDQDGFHDGNLWSLLKEEWV